MIARMDFNVRSVMRPFLRWVAELHVCIRIYLTFLLTHGHMDTCRTCGCGFIRTCQGYYFEGVDTSCQDQSLAVGPSKRMSVTVIPNFHIWMSFLAPQPPTQVPPPCEAMVFSKIRKDGRRTYKGYYSWHFTYISISTSGHRLRCDKLVLRFDRTA